MNALIVVVSIALYVFIGAMMGWTFYQKRTSQCTKCSRNYCYDEHELVGVAFGALWPVMIPVMGGILSAEWNLTRPERKQSKHDRKMAELKAEEDRNESAIRLLEAEGWKARVS